MTKRQVVAQKVEETELSEQDPLLLTRNLLRIAIFNISYIRGLFPEKYFNDESFPALDMKIKKLMPLDAESRRLIDWMEKGVYDALQQKYLKTLMFCVCEAVDGPMIEEYAFSFSYSNTDSQEVSMNINRSGTKKGGTLKYNSSSKFTPSQMRNSACKMVKTLIQLMRTLDKMPEERTVLMKLFYYDDVTPMDYEPPFFRGCTEEEAHNPWSRSPLKMAVGQVNSKHLVLALKVKSVLYPCEDENNDDQDDELSLGDDSQNKDGNSDSDSEISNSDDDNYIVAQREKRPSQEDKAAIDEDNTEDEAEDEHQLGLVKDWISSYHLDTVELTDVLSNFPAISVALLEEIMDKLVKEGVISKAGDYSYIITKKKNDYDFDAVKEEVEALNFGKAAGPASVDRMHMKALSHAIPMDYITAKKLQKKHDGEATPTTVRKRVIHSDLTKKKLSEVQKFLYGDVMDVDTNEPANLFSHPESETIGNKRDVSTCGGLHSIGSDITRTRGRNEQELKELGGSTPISKSAPAASRESFAVGTGTGRVNGNNRQGDDMDIVMASMSTQEKHFRKTSTSLLIGDEDEKFEALTIIVGLTEKGCVFLGGDTRGSTRLENGIVKVMGDNYTKLISLTSRILIASSGHRVNVYKVTAPLCERFKNLTPQTLQEVVDFILSILRDKNANFQKKKIGFILAGIGGNGNVGIYSLARSESGEVDCTDGTDRFLKRGSGSVAVTAPPIADREPKETVKLLFKEMKKAFNQVKSCGGERIVMEIRADGVIEHKMSKFVAKKLKTEKLEKKLNKNNKDTTKGSRYTSSKFSFF